MAVAAEFSIKLRLPPTTFPGQAVPDPIDTGVPLSLPWRLTAMEVPQTWLTTVDLGVSSTAKLLLIVEPGPMENVPTLTWMFPPNAACLKIRVPPHRARLP